MIGCVIGSLVGVMLIGTALLMCLRNALSMFVGDMWIESLGKSLSSNILNRQGADDWCPVREG